VRHTRRHNSAVIAQATRFEKHQHPGTGSPARMYTHLHVAEQLQVMTSQLMPLSDNDLKLPTQLWFVTQLTNIDLHVSISPVMLSARPVVGAPTQDVTMSMSLVSFISAINKSSYHIDI